MPDPTGVRRRIAEYLMANGPTWGDRAAEALGLTLDQWWAAVGQCRWFDMAVGGWVVTSEGKRECNPAT